jgi:hypothetical protein
MTIVRIAHAEPRPGKLENGGFETRGYLVVLADDAGHRAVPVWLSGEPGEADLAELVDLAAQPGAAITADIPQELAARLLSAAGARVTGVDIDVTVPGSDQLSPQAAVARVGLSGPAGTREVAATLSLGLAMAAAAGAPVRLDEEVLTRLAVPVPGEDLISPLLSRVPLAAQVVPGRRPEGAAPVQRPRFEPLNLDFADGLDRWDLDAGPRGEAATKDYSAATDGESAVLSSAVRQPAGSAALVQTIFADDYRGATVVFRGGIRTEPHTEQSGLRLEIFRHWRPREHHGITVVGGNDNWSTQEISALIPEDALMIRFGIMLTGTGGISLRNPDLGVTQPGPGA